MPVCIMNCDMPIDYAYISLNHPDYDLAYLKNRGVVDFIHFTPAENLPGILRGGFFLAVILISARKNTSTPIASV